MNSLPNREADVKEEKKKALPGQEALIKDFDEFTAQLKKEGFFEPNTAHIMYRIFEVFFMHALGGYLLFNGHYAAGVIILGIVSGRCGWLMHEAGHYSLTGSIPLDKQIQVWLYGVGCGKSASWWRSQHNKHHSMPQKLFADPDLATLPLVAFFAKVVKKANSILKGWIFVQAAAFPLITCLLVALGWQFYLHPRHIVRTKQWSEGLALLTRAALFWGVFVPQLGVLGAVKFYILYNWVEGSVRKAWLGV
jgi:acyl-CoA 6-desaturase (Delta-6 desaturase)